MVSKNPNYYTGEIEAHALANLQTRVISRDKLILYEEVGEGAFGKVYRGELNLDYQILLFYVKLPMNLDLKVRSYLTTTMYFLSLFLTVMCEQ